MLVVEAEVGDAAVADAGVLDEAPLDGDVDEVETVAVPLVELLAAVVVAEAAVVVLVDDEEVLLCQWYGKTSLQSSLFFQWFLKSTL